MPEKIVAQVTAIFTSSTVLRGRLGQAVIYSNLLLMGLSKALKMRP
jgi:hypothetical protein